MLQENACFLWPDYGRMSLQRNECHDIAVRTDGFSGIQEIVSQKTVHIILPAEDCRLNFFFDEELICNHSVDCHFD